MQILNICHNTKLKNPVYNILDDKDIAKNVLEETFTRRRHKIIKSSVKSRPVYINLDFSI